MFSQSWFTREKLSLVPTAYLQDKTQKENLNEIVKMVLRISLKCKQRAIAVPF